jgi:hypothetical protein
MTVTAVLLNLISSSGRRPDINFVARRETQYHAEAPDPAVVSTPKPATFKNLTD